MTPRRSRPPVWALASSSIGIVALIAGWLIGAAVQPPGYDPIHETISALARHGAEHRWIMTAGLGLLGLAHVVSAAGLSMLRPASRLVLATAGLTTLGVTFFAQPAHGSSAAHIAFATAGFVLLALWPATTAYRANTSDGPPAVLSRHVAFAATAVSVALLIWVGATQFSGPLGLAERLLTAEQALWPFVVVVALRRSTATICA